MFCITCVTTAIGFIIWVVYKFLNGKDKRKPPQLHPIEWWGPEDLKGKQDESIRPFEVKFSDEMIQDLKDRLKSHRPIIPPLEGVGFRYGFNSTQLPSWLSYWAEEYPFKERERFFNKYPHYKTSIQGLDIHFIWVKPQVPSGVKVLPLLMMHGWPGSMREFYEVIPMLTRQTPGYDFVFELIIPCMPGYGFSDAPIRPGLGAPKVAVIFRNLMKRLGFRQYYVQGGDWGAVIASAMATLYPEDLLGHHSNVATARNLKTSVWSLIGAYFPSLVAEPHQASRMYPLYGWLEFAVEELGYFFIQTTKPDTIGIALSDSPVGLLVYILEKFSTWTCREYRDRHDGGLCLRFTKEQLIDNLMVYWCSNSIVTSLRFYAESFSKATRALDLDSYPTPVPTWALQAPHEILYQPPKLLQMKFPKLLGHTHLNDGGHFIALEQPRVLAEDVFRAVRAFREWHFRNGKTDC